VSAVEELRAALTAFAADLPVETVTMVGDQLSTALGALMEIRGTSDAAELADAQAQLANEAGDHVDRAMESLGNIRALIETYAARL
jgi:predicted negative regulator of RcsB-dependent stress response